MDSPNAHDLILVDSVVKLRQSRHLMYLVDQHRLVEDVMRLN
jgi:hypothetical protein